METYFYIHLISFLICLAGISYELGIGDIQSEKDATYVIIGCFVLGPLALFITFFEALGKSHKRKSNDS